MYQRGGAITGKRVTHLKPHVEASRSPTSQQGRYCISHGLAMFQATFKHVFFFFYLGRLSNVSRERKNQPKVFLHKVFSKSRTSRPKSRDIPATPCLKQQQKATGKKFLSGISRRLGPEFPRNILPKNLS